MFIWKAFRHDRTVQRKASTVLRDDLVNSFWTFDLTSPVWYTHICGNPLLRNIFFRLWNKL